MPARRNPLGSGLGVSSVHGSREHVPRGCPPAWVAIPSVRVSVFRRPTCWAGRWMRWTGSPVAIPSVRVSVFRHFESADWGEQTFEELSQSPRFGSRCFVQMVVLRLRAQGYGEPPVAIPSVRVSVFRQGWQPVEPGRMLETVAIPSVRVSVFRPGY